MCYPQRHTSGFRPGTKLLACCCEHSAQSHWGKARTTGSLPLQNNTLSFKVCRLGYQNKMGLQPGGDQNESETFVAKPGDGLETAYM